MIERRSQLDKIIITAMDRFVWFVLLVVMSHLVTEFTRVSGYARGPRHELVLLNDTMLQPMPVQNMLLYPSHEYDQYQQRPSMNSLQQNAALLFSSLAAGAGAGAGTGASAEPSSNAAILAVGDSQPAHNSEPSYPLFSLRPLIDSIFEMGRLTGSYRQATAEVSQKSVAEGTVLPLGHPSSNPTADSKFSVSQRRAMRE
ncbi:uncharacterized protein LOC117192711 isoform X2 [Drosophila miranda]|uniref:uncharacterized protein LOC117192711 isoform X2 n=1 Tax=Drosophila miranda TaxID=7229 RepID=UPI00143F2C15|nr:uncharacterized protein LOC117192711 isoform X2 [Drosophila miranda]